MGASGQDLGGGPGSPKLLLPPPPLMGLICMGAICQDKNGPWLGALLLHVNLGAASLTLCSLSPLPSTAQPLRAHRWKLLHEGSYIFKGLRLRVLKPGL